MKKVALLALLLMFSASIVSAETVRSTVKSTSEKVGNFWSREAERAGWKDSTSHWGNFWNNINPVNFFKNQQDAYNARKAGAGTTGVMVK